MNFQSGGRMLTALDERIATMERGYILDHNGLMLVKDNLTRTEWETLGRELVERHETTGWALIDWVMLHRGEWGKMYDHVIQITRLSYITVSNLHALGRAFPRDRRIAGLSRTHHRNVVALPPEEQIPTLMRARDERWSADKLGAVVAQMNKDRAKGITSPSAASATRRRIPATCSEFEALAAPRVRCPSCETVFPVKPNLVP